MSGNVTFSNNIGVTGTRTAGTAYDSYSFTIPSSKRTEAASKSYTITGTNGSKSASCTLTTTSKFRFSYDKNGGETIGAPTHYDALFGSQVASNFPTTGTRVGYEFIGMSTAGTSHFEVAKPSDFTGNLKSTQTITTDTVYKATWWAKSVNITFLKNDGSPVTDTNGDPITLMGKYDKPAKYNPANGSEYTMPGDPGYVYSPGVNNGSFTYEFVGWAVDSAQQYKLNTDDGTQTQEKGVAGTEYSDIVGMPFIGNGSDATILKGDTVFRAVYRIASVNKYPVTFYNGSATPPAQTGEYRYKQTVTAPTVTKAADHTYTYTFKGWATQANPNEYIYIYSVEDGEKVFDDGCTHTILTGNTFTVYDRADYVAVYEKTYIPYTVNFIYTDRTKNPDGTFSYTLAQNHEVDYHYNDFVEVPVDQYHEEEGKETKVFDYVGAVANAENNKLGYRYKFTGWDATPSERVTASATYRAQYIERVGIYNIKFVDYDGSTLNPEEEYDPDSYNPEDEEHTAPKNIGWFKYGTNISAVMNAADPTKAATLFGVTKATSIWDDDEYRHNFIGWDKTVQTTASDNAVYTAAYDSVPLYTVIYADENGELGTWKGTTDENIPLAPDGVNTPTKANDDFAKSYVFSGWSRTPYVRETAPDPEISSTSNLRVPEGGTTVYAQFRRDPIIYTINFAYEAPDGSLVSLTEPQTLRFGQEIQIPTGNGLARADDETYHYTFSGWEVEPETTVNDRIAFETDENDENPTVTYIANYRKSYVYYDVRWLYQNGDQVEGEDHVMRDFRVEKYVYGERIRAPFSTPTIRTTDQTQDPLLPPLQNANSEYAFDQWVLAKKIDGQWKPVKRSGETYVPLTAEDYAQEPEAIRALLVPFSTSLKIENLPTGFDPENDALYAFLPTYKSVDAKRILTIKYEDTDGTIKTETMELGLGEKIFGENGDRVSDPPVKGSTETTHFKFNGWVYDGTETAVGTDDTITGNVTIVATYLEEEHTYRFSGEDKTKPTFETAGVVTMVCNESGCGHTKDVTLGMLSDGVRPDVRLYVKNTSWDSTKPNPALTALTENVIPIAPNSLLIANGADSADPTTFYVKKTDLTVKRALVEGTDNPADYEALTYNADGVGSRVNDIWAYYSELTDETPALTIAQLDEVPNATPENANGWHSIYTRRGNEEANHSDVFASFEPAIEDGKQYVVYLKAIDAAGNENYISSDRLGYDTTAPVVTLTTEAGGNAAGTKFCLDATIVLEEEDLTVLLDGSEITMTAVTDEETEVTTYEYKVETIGKHTVRVTDPAGNTVLKAFEIIGEHKTTETYKAATCTEDGWKKDVCNLCGNAIGETTTYTATGHDYQTKTKRATCTEAGYTQEICSKCGDQKDPEPIAALGHDWNDGTITKQPNCTENGRIVYRCTRCGINDIVEGDALDTEAAGYDAEAAAAIVDAHPDLEDAASILHDGESHSFKADRQTTNPTCTEQGEITHECRYCHEVFHVADVNALGHDWTADENDENAWSVVPGHDATCTAAGAKYPKVCARCGAANEDMEGQIEIEALGHRYEENTEKSKVPSKDEHNQWITYDNVFIGEYYIDDEGNMIDDANKVGEMKTVYGYAYYVCTNDQHHIKVVEIVPDVEYTYTFVVDGVVTTVTKTPGEQITLADLPSTDKDDTPTTRYYFDKWMVEGTTEEAVFPMIISQDTGNKTFVAQFREETVYYTITFYEEDGTTKINEAGFKTYEQEFVQVGPEKAPDENYVYTFKGWIPKDADPATATPLTTIKVLGNAEYKAVYERALRTYTVVWEVDGRVVNSKQDVPAGSTLGEGELAYPGDQTKAYDDFYHYTFTGWSPAAGATVAGNTRIVAQFQKTAHVCTATPAAADCTHPARTINACTCGYSYETTSGSALGHDYSILVTKVNPTNDNDGYKIMKCSRCDSQTRIELPRIFMKVTVKNQNGNPVSGVTVKVYETDANGGAFVNSGVTDGSGVATILVPEAKAYRVEIEGNSANVNVDQNGNVSGKVPTVERSSGGGNTSHGCDCTCHKSGFWPMIFRFFHKIIKMITGEFRCCPDANY